MAEHRSATAHPTGPALRVRGLRHRFGDKVAVDGIDLTIERGEVFGLLGPNGAGKTTTIRVVNTLLPVQEGTVEVLGFDARRAAMAVRRRLGYVPQQLSIEAALTGRENVSWFARLFDVPRSARKERVADALAVMGLSDVADRMAGTYSGGMVRRLELAQALVNRPALLVLDEPTVGLDPVARDGVWQRVAEMCDATGMTVLLTTHYMEEADVLCDRLALMHLGRIRALGSPAELKAALGPEASLEDVFRHHTGNSLEEEEGRGREVCVRSAQLDAPRAEWGDGSQEADPAVWRQFPNRVATFCLVEIQKLRHDRTEIFTRAVQPVLWLLIFGETFTRIHAIPTGGVPYLDFLAPGIIAQSGLFVAIFYGIQIIWERDAGVLTKLLVTPTPRAALIFGKSFAAGIRALAQVVVVLVLSAILGVALTLDPLRIIGTFVIVMMGSAFFACLSMTVAGVVLKRDRLMGIGQMITMPLFFASNALYPVKIMPGWLQVLALINPLSYEVDALRGLLISTPAHLPLDFGVLALSVAVGVTAASSLVGRLAR